MTKRNQVSQSREQSNNIAEHIKHELTRIQGCNEKLYQLCNALDQSFNLLTNEIDDHLNKIVAQMPDYDKHDSSHSNRVLAIIERLLNADGIREMPFLEAEMLRFCCHFHDVGMAVPDWCFSLLRKVEPEGFIWHRSREEIRNALRNNTDNWAPAKTFSEVRDLFLIPETELDFLDWLADLIWAYEDYRKGLLPWDGHGNRTNWDQETREDFFRSTHGMRAEQYSKGLWKKFPCLNKYHAIQYKISSDIGKICASHTQQFDCVEDLPALETVLPGIEDEALSYSPRFISMLLRLGDVLDFSEDRASLTLYAERSPMNHVSDKHWQVKNLTGLAIQIRTDSTKNKKISFMGCFSKPEHYYFIHDYLDWADEELCNYSIFLKGIDKGETKTSRYQISLPAHVERSGIIADNFTPDPDLRFTLDQNQIIQLLMGAQLYSNEYSCIRELYQNALDASRCMFAINSTKGISCDLQIVFGLETDAETGQKFLYCRDSGIGMTKEIIKKYLLRVGNSYYRSSDFRRNNLGWKIAVHPISEFGIGILSCFLIGNRIEIITIHYDLAVPLHVCMDGAEGYGYFLEPTPRILDRLGDHGTEVRVFLKPEYAEALYNNLPESKEEAFDLISLLQIQLSRGIKWETLTRDAEKILIDAHKQLWFKLQRAICVPEPFFPVIVKNDNFTYRLQDTQKRYPYEQRWAFLQKYDPYYGTQGDPELIAHVINMGQYVFEALSFIDESTQSEVRTWFALPIPPKVDVDDMDILEEMDRAHHSDALCVDGLHVDIDRNIDDGGYECYRQLPDFLYNFKGASKPKLTVSREFICQLGEETIETCKTLTEGIFNEICSKVIRYFEQHSEANTDSNRSFAIVELFNKGKPYHGQVTDQISQRYMVWHKLSSSKPFCNHVEQGIPFGVFNGTVSQFSIPITSIFSFFNRSRKVAYLRDIFYAVINNAQSVHLLQNDVLINIGQFKTSCKEYRIDPHDVCLLFPNNWPYDYDFYCNLFPLVSPQLRKCISETVLVDDVASFATVPVLQDISCFLTDITYSSDNKIAIPPWHILFSQLSSNGFACWCASIAEKWPRPYNGVN